MYGRDAPLPRRALGYFKGGDLPSLRRTDLYLLRAARDRLSKIPTCPTHMAARYLRHRWVASIISLPRTSS